MSRVTAKTAAWFLGVTTTVLVAVEARAVDYGATGPTAIAESDLPSGFGGANGGKLVVPRAEGRHPLIVASHGFSANSSNQVGWARHFASHGFVVAVPNFPGGLSPNHVRNGEIIAAIVRALPTAETAAKGKVDPDRIGLEGHSAGGLATALAAAAIQPGATVLFDPVDNGGRGEAAQPRICGAILSIFAKPSSCNNNTGWFAFRAEAMGEVASFRVKGATHCDGENLPRGLCGTTCGGAANAARQALHARYATAFFRAHLMADAEAAGILADAALRAENGIEEVVTKRSTGCTASDAGVDAAPIDAAPIDAGRTDAGRTDAGPTDGAVSEVATDGSARDAVADAPAEEVSDATLVDATDANAADAPGDDPGSVDETPPAVDEGCGCRAAGRSADGVALATATVLLALVVRGRRRRA
jgi:dienelactone hydrolase